jgi:ribonuclease R
VTDRLVARVEDDGRGALQAVAMLDGQDGRWPVHAGSTDTGDPGDVFVAEIRDGTAHLIERLARTGTARAEMFAVALGAGLNPLHPPEAEAEAAEFVRAPGLDDATLRDLEGLAFVTIDNEDSRDLDQALYLETREDGGFRVLYALADAAYYVRPERPCFSEAMRRGATFYLPGLAIPMLPRSLCEGIISLNPDVPRRALVFDIALDSAGRAAETSVYRARIRSRAKLSYDGVQGWFDGDSDVSDGSKIDAADCARSLRTLAEVGRRRMALAIERDVVRYRRQEVEIRYGPSGTSFVALAEDRNDVERWNEQISLLCNTEGARLLLDAITPDRRENLQPIFRVHDPPHHRQVDQLESFVRRWVAASGADPSVWGWRRSDEESLATYLDRLPDGTPATRRRVRAIHRQALIINQRSRFDAEPGPHYGVGAEHYARFSAPMREMVGIFTHKELIEWLVGRADEPPTFDDEALRAHIVDRANAAKRVQSRLNKAVNRLAIDPALESSTGRVLRGTLMGLTARRAYIRFDDPPIEVKVYFDSAKRHGAELRSEDEVLLHREDADAQTRWAVGDAIDVEVVGREDERWVLVPALP